MRKIQQYSDSDLLEEVAANLERIPFPIQRKLPIIGWFLVISNCVILFYVTIYPGWKISDQSANPPNTKGMFTFDGLFNRCIKPNPMRFQCDQYQLSILGLPQSLQIMRALACLALAFCCVSIFPALLSLDCVNMPGLSRYTKTIMGMMTAILQLISGK